MNDEVWVLYAEQIGYTYPHDFEEITYLPLTVQPAFAEMVLYVTDKFKGLANWRGHEFTISRRKYNGGNELVLTDRYVTKAVKFWRAN